MAQNIRSLWSPDIKAIVLSPSTILKGQADALAIQTGGVLLAEIVEDREENDDVSLSFDLVAPALQGSRHRILKVIHRDGLPYPAWLEAEILRSKYGAMVRANTDQEFTATVAEILKSGQVSSVAQSLVARANEALAIMAPAQ